MRAEGRRGSLWPWGCGRRGRSGLTTRPEGLAFRRNELLNSWVEIGRFISRGHVLGGWYGSSTVVAQRAGLKYSNRIPVMVGERRSILASWSSQQRPPSKAYLTQLESLSSSLAVRRVQRMVKGKHRGLWAEYFGLRHQNLTGK